MRKGYTPTTDKLLQTSTQNFCVMEHVEYAKRKHR